MARRGTTPPSSDPGGASGVGPAAVEALAETSRDEGTADVPADASDASVSDLVGALAGGRGAALLSRRSEVPGGVVLESELPMDPDDDLSAVEDGEVSERLVSIVESLLFAAAKPLRVRDLRRVLKDASKRQIQLALLRIQQRGDGRGVVLGLVAGGFRLATHPQNAAWVQQLLAGRPAHLSRSQLETLAIIAYRQPVTRAELDHVRGVDCGAVLRGLMEIDLVKIVGRKEEPGRPHLYGTTVRFLEFFTLRSLRDLPDLREFRELSDESRAVLREELGPDAADHAEIMGQEPLDLDPPEAPDEGR